MGARGANISLRSFASNTEFDVLYGLNEVVVESRKPFLIVPHVVFVELLLSREIRAWR